MYCKSRTTTIQCFQESVLLRRTPERTSLHILAESQQNSLEYDFYSLGVAPFLPLSALESKPKGHVAPSSRLSACPTKGNKSTRRNCWDAGHVVTIDIAVFQTLTSAQRIHTRSYANPASIRTYLATSHTKP